MATRELSPGLRRVLYGTALIDLTVGLLFILDPELGTAPWPKEISPVLVRFIGSIVIANAAGLVVAARTGTWEGARALFAVAVVYGAVALVAVTAQLLSDPDGQGVLWIYVAVLVVFLGPILAVIARYERGR